jgi:hypothetical protein
MIPDQPGTITAAVQRVLPSARAGLERLVRMPSVSADLAATPYLEESSRTVAALLSEAGLPEVEVLSAGGAIPAYLVDGPSYQLLQDQWRHRPARAGSS